MRHTLTFHHEACPAGALSDFDRNFTGIDRPTVVDDESVPAAKSFQLTL